MTRQALVVGINRYPFLQQHLERAAADAEAIAQRLKKSGGDDWTVRLLTETVSQSNLLQEICELFPSETNQAPDVALLFFAGHGVRKKPLEEKNASYEGFLVTSDANPRKDKWGISLIELREILLKSKVKKQMVWLDCCHSGELLNFLTGDELQGWLEGGDRLLIAACRDDKTAFGVGEHGVLTKVLLEAINPEQNLEDEWISSWSVKKVIDKQLESNEILKQQIPLVENFGREIKFWRGKKQIAPLTPPKASIFASFVNTIEKKYRYLEHLPPRIADQKWKIIASASEEELTTIERNILKLVISYCCYFKQGFPTPSAEYRGSRPKNYYEQLLKIVKEGEQLENKTAKLSSIIQDSHLNQIIRSMEGSK